MSGICGAYRLDGASIASEELADMVQLLRRRGPDDHGLWHGANVALGHTLLWTLPESVPGQLPFVCTRSGCVITGDVRLDNREPLLAALDARGELRQWCDERLVLDAYLAWGEACVDRLLGDFAFAIWDSRRRHLFGARDPMGIRPLYYHHSTGRLFAFASEPRSILVLPQVPYQLNEKRIADFLVTQLEGIDKTSTFFDGVHRLPPAHCFRVTPDGLSIRRYWQLEPGPEISLPSDDDYAQAFLEIFTEAVRTRLRGRIRVGSMLSGGMDSGSIVAVASQLLCKSGAGPLATFSAIAEDEADCVESRAVRAALTMKGLEPTTVHPGQLGQLQPELDRLTWNLDEPFDNHMTVPRVMYLAARQRGIHILLDGIDGDTVLSEGRYLARLVRRGRWCKAWGETRAQARFWGPAVSPSPARDFLAAARLAWIPGWLRRFRKRMTNARHDRLLRNIRDSLISPDFAAKINLKDRLDALERHRTNGLVTESGHEHAAALDHPYVTVAVERYDRIASAVGVEPRHPFLDPRLMDFCVSLPGEQKLRNGWPKAVLRHAMAGKLPELVRWRRGKEHLGQCFTKAYATGLDAGFLSLDEGQLDGIVPFMSSSALLTIRGRQVSRESYCQHLFDAVHLAAWLENWQFRPTVATGQLARELNRG